MCKLHIMLDDLDSVLAPIARLLVAQGVSFPDLAERMKAHYVDAAAQNAEGKVTDSRLSVMTGLQRRDIARLRGFQPRDPRISHEARLVAMWQTRPEYRDASGLKILPRTGQAPSFEALAWDVRRDVHPRTMLDTLVAAGTVEVTEADQVRLLQSSYQPLAGSEAQLEYLAKNVGDHLAAAADNVLMDTAPHFERAVHYGGLNSDQVAELRVSFEAAQMELFQRLSTRAAEMKRGPGGGGGSHRFRGGGYFYETEDQT